MAKTVILSSLDGKTSEYLEPTLEEVAGFGVTIGLPYLEPERRLPKWYNLLHDLAHWAVYPQKVTEDFLSYQKYQKIPRGQIPYPVIGWPRSIQHSSWYADEWGARAWGLEVLKVKGWVNPLKLYYDSGRPSDYPELDPNELVGKYQLWDSTEVKDGYQQLARWGVSPTRGAFRPTRNEPIAIKDLELFESVQRAYRQGDKFINLPNHWYQARVLEATTATQEDIELSFGDPKHSETWEKAFKTLVLPADEHKSSYYCYDPDQDLYDWDWPYCRYPMS